MEGTAESTSQKDNESVELVLEMLRTYLTTIGPVLLAPENLGLRDNLANTLLIKQYEDILIKFIQGSEYPLLTVELTDDDLVLIGLEVRSSDFDKLKSSFILIKIRNMALEPSRSIPQQLQLVSLLMDQTASSEDARQNTYLYNMQQVTRYLFAPMTKSLGINEQKGEQGSGPTTSEDDPISILQNRVRELDVALDQCQRGSSIPSVVLHIPAILVEKSKASTAANLRNFLERYNASQVDSLLHQLGLSVAIGDNEQKKEEFVTEVTKLTKSWPSEISRQTRLLDSQFAGSIDRELNFWKDLDKKLHETKEQLESPAILLTKLVLKRTNRVAEQLIHEAELSLDRCIKLVEISLTFLRDFPIKDINDATLLHPKLSRGIANCLVHFAKLKHSQYDFSRALRLLESLGSMAVNKIISLLKEKNIMQCSLNELNDYKHQFEEIMNIWKENLTTQRSTLKDIAKRRNEDFSAYKLKFEFDALSNRFITIVDFRQHHESMVTILSKVLEGSDGDRLISALSEAYHIVVRKNTDMFDLTSTGFTLWSTSIHEYERKVEIVEENIQKILTDRLHSAKSADEMFRIFALFNPLFYRPAIRNAVNSFRATLMKTVREDVKRLQDKFRLRYDESYEKITAELRDIPPLSGRIIWAKQIENQLSMILKRIQDVLGNGWEEHIEGKELKEVCDELRNYLDTNTIYEDWLNLQMKTDGYKYSKTKDFLLLVEEDPRSPTGNKFLKVNFDHKQIIVYKEVKYLEWLLPSMNVAHKIIPSTIRSRALEAYHRYPTVLILESTLQVYHTAKSRINAGNVALLANHLQAVRDMIKDAFGGSKRSRWIKWDSPELSDWVNSFTLKVNSLQERVDDVVEKLKIIEKHVEKLVTCECNRGTMEGVLNAIQLVIDELPMKGLSNVPVWVQQLDERIEGILKEKLVKAVQLWCESFEQNHSDDVYDETTEIRGGADETKNALTTPGRPRRHSVTVKTKFIIFEPFVHEISVSNQLLSVEPNLGQAKKYWIDEFHRFVMLIVTLPRLVAQRFQVFAEAATTQNNYSNILKQVSKDVMLQPYLTIEKKMIEAEEYVKSWLQYQALWDASVSEVTSNLHKDFPLWERFLTDIRLARTTVDGAEEDRAFGPIIVRNKQAQIKIIIKYDAWQRESQSRFASILVGEIKEFHQELIGAKNRLESLTLEGSTRDAILAIGYIIQLKGLTDAYGEKVHGFQSSEKLLKSQRFAFPSDWIATSNLEGSYSAMNDILQRRLNAMNVQLPILQQKIKEEDSLIANRIEKLLESWNVQKPIEGKLKPNAALETLSIFSSQLLTLIDETNRLREAKESLRMDYITDDRLSYVMSEVNDLKEAWNTVSPYAERLEKVAATLVKDFNATTIRKQVEEIINDMKSKISNKIRSYAAVEALSEKLQKYLAQQPVIRDLASEAMKDRHWKSLLDKMRITEPLKNVTLGLIWESNALQYRKFIQEVFTTAQGELALEQFLADLREQWNTREFTLAIRDQTKIIAGWDILFTALEDHLLSLGSLKQSPYFRNVPEFQEDSIHWETRLTNLRGICEAWIEVQRKFIYLRSIFKNVDIKAQLPAQYSKFKSIENEYTSLMKRISAKPLILDVLQYDNLLRQLERQDSTMTYIQKALGDYLEKQRQIFPRFYFVNNDDLVEIIGNSNEPLKIFSHLSKMFAAVNSLEIIKVPQIPSSEQPNASGEDSHAQAMISKEGEYVKMVKSFSLTQGVKEWLQALYLEMINTLSTSLHHSFAEFSAEGQDSLLTWMQKYPTQVVILATQLSWTYLCEKSLLHDRSSPASPQKSNIQPTTLNDVVALIEKRLQTLSQSVLQKLDADLRRKCEQLLTEMVHQRDVVRALVQQQVATNTDFGWLYHLRYYVSPEKEGGTKKLLIKMSNASFQYGYEYLGVAERLVQTPLTDRCYLTLTQALHLRMGGNPNGPAGTGKTESVKMLGNQLGRFVLVFNCDSAFDYAAMGRIFSGLCQVGAWGCFDEFNRLEERILSAVSQQILTIQRGLLTNQPSIDLLDQPCKLSKDVGIFVTLNPGYAGRSNLPDNLKQLFRAIAMNVPDRKLIAQVMLFSQGISTAEDLAGKIVLLFILCEEQLSSQQHYDFGLRALKSVLVGAGELKRKALAALLASSGSSAELGGAELGELETKVLIKSTCDSILPKLIADDIPLFMTLLTAVFPDCEIPNMEDEQFVDAVKAVCVESHYQLNDVWLEKILQLKQIQDIRHGIMLVGPSATGKSATWKVLLRALNRLERSTTGGQQQKSDYYIIDAKSIKKEKLYGSLDPTTLEWTDGIFTKILRKIIEATSEGNSGATSRYQRRSWIVFDGDVDPEWAENLNSVLDDNKILTLPSGDRLKIPPNVRIIMEVDNLKYTTLATVSRCGMIWFADNVITLEMIFQRQLALLKSESYLSERLGVVVAFDEQQQNLQEKFVDAITPSFLQRPSIVEIALQYSKQQPHVMEISTVSWIDTLFAMLIRGISLCFEQNDATPDFPLPDAQIESFANRWLLFALNWSFGSSLPLDKRQELSKLIEEHTTILIQPGGGKKAVLLDLFPNIQDGEWIEWNTMVPKIEIESHRVSSSDVVISTIDTLRHTEVLKSWLQSRRPIVLCGPPGSGKTMTLTSLLEQSPEYILVSLNFSSGTTPELILKTFAQYCEIVDSPDGLVLQPNKASYRDNQWLVVFCDEINLPAPDSYGTQRVIMFLRQLTEQQGYWNQDCKWIHLRRIQFVGACNPPTDAGRSELSSRFLRQAAVLFVDYPAEASLKQIYRTFNHGLLKLHPNLKGFVDSLNDAMIEFYLQNKQKFTPDVAPQYIYSPRELSRWVRAMYEAMEPLDAMTPEELVRLWGHEALRLFHDRLIEEPDRVWCQSLVDNVATRHFPGVDVHECLKRPILYSQWLRKTYQSTDRELLRDFVAARLKIFYEEELDVPLCIFDEVLDHVLRIDNVLRHPIGHLLLVGEAGTGKTVLTRFVAWMNGLTVFQIKATNRYSIENFDDDLRQLLRRVGVEGEKICFIFDESNALSSAFLERMNALLASGEIPGLFEGEEKNQLMAACRDSFNQRDGIIFDSEDELYRRFTKVIQKNLHVVFTMNPASADFESRCTTSPALFNRCVVDWFGTWGNQALTQVAADFTVRIDTGYVTYTPPRKPPSVLIAAKEILKQEETNATAALVASVVSFHDTVKSMIYKHSKQPSASANQAGNRPQHYLSPRDYLDFINKFLKLEEEKRSALEDQQTHIRTGLQKLLETQDQVSTLNHDLNAKNEILQRKDQEANQKLTQMIEKQNEAEQRKVIAEQLTAQLIKQNEEIRVRKEVVEKELSEAEPALISAKNSVQNIRKQQLDEVRALPKPPNAVKLTLEMVSTMIGESSLDWNDIRKVIRREDFIATVVNFDPLTLTAKQIKAVQDNYLSNAELDYASVDRASKACGPLFQWAGSQIKYATILRKIKPLRDEMAVLSEQLVSLEEKQIAAKSDLQELEAAIKTYKAEYAAAIRETEMIRSEMEVVSKRVQRANALLASLQEEKVRWEATSLSFDQQMSTLIGDCLLAAAFLTYVGPFDHRYRMKLMMEWSENLEDLSIPFRTELDMVNYLSKPTEQLTWTEYGLPNDTLAVQNAILLKRYYRFPLIIDPAGQAYQYILQQYSAQKMIQTSFLDNSFIKTLISAIRFGTPLLVNDVENMDPTLNPILNREFQRSGGRVVVHIGNEEIDFSPKFFLVLFTRNSYAKFPPDLCSRVTMINFSITPASLESQVLSEVLKSERPDIDQRRSNVLRLQSEQNAKLRDLQDMLLDRISAVQGAILDDDSVILTLESIKQEAEALHNEVSKTSDILEEVKMISNLYLPLATMVSTSYFTLESLAEVSFLYQYSLNFFLQVVKTVLFQKSSTGATANATSNTSVGARTKHLKSIFLQELSRRVLPGLRYEDQLIFLVRLSYIAAQNNTTTSTLSVNSEIYDVEMDFLTKGNSHFTEVTPTMIQKFQVLFDNTGNAAKVTPTQVKNLVSMSLLPSFQHLATSLQQNMNEWISLIENNFPEQHVPTTFLTSAGGGGGLTVSGKAAKPPSEERLAFLKVLLIRALRPERLLYALEDYLTLVYQSYDCQWRDLAVLDVKTMVLQDGNSLTPTMFCSEPGQDASNKVETLSLQSGKRLLQVAMGSSEGFVEAERLIAQASKTGDWVLLKNVHLCIDWLTSFEKKWSSATNMVTNGRSVGASGGGYHENFRLFLTSEIHASLPIALLRKSQVIIMQSSTGLKASLWKFFSNIPVARIEKPPVERCRLYSLLIWFNAILQERLRYCPLGWSKRYEFNESDIACTLDVIDQWIDEVNASLGPSGGQRLNINPQQLPWSALQVLIAQSLYGGRIDHPFDQVRHIAVNF